MSTESYSVEISEEGSGTNKLIKAVEQLTQSTNKLVSATDKASGSTAKAGSAARKAADDQSYLAKAMGGVSGIAGTLAGALGGVATALSIGKLVEYADTYTNIGNKLRLVSTDQKVTNDIMNKAFAIAQQTGTEFAGVATTYGKVSQTLRTMGKDTSDAEGVTRTIAQSLQLAGTSAESTKAGLLQFEQGLSAGVLRGEEFNSVVENTPGLAMALAAGIKQSGAISVGALRQMAENGELTTNRVIEALQRVAPNIDMLAKTSIPTVSASFQRLQNAVVKYVGEANTANGFTAKLAGAIDFLSQNLNKAAPIAAGFMAVLAVGAFAAAANAIVTLTGAVAALTVGIVGLTAAMLANPLILGAVVAAFVAANIAMKAYGVSVADVVAKFATFATGLTAAVTANTVATAATNANATANRGLSTAITGVGTATTAAGAAATTAAPGFRDVGAAAGSAGQSFEELKNKAPAVNSGFRELEQSTGAAEKGIQNINKAVPKTIEKFIEVQTASLDVNNALLDVETTGSITAKSVDKLTDAVNDNAPALDKAADAAKGTGDAAKGYASATDAVSKALANLLPNQNAATAAVSKAANTYKAATENVNAYGEKLMSIEDFLSRTKAAQDRLNDSISESIDRVKSAKIAQEDFRTSTAGLATAMDTASSGSSGGGYGSGGGGYGSGGGGGSEGGSFGGTPYMPVGAGGKVWGYVNLETQGAGGADVNQQIMLTVDRIQKTFSGIEVTDENKSNLSATIKSMLGPFASRYTPAFANGGSFRVGGSGGTDSQPVSFMASPNERVTIETPEQVRKREAQIANGARPAIQQGPRQLIVQTTIRSDEVDQYQRSRQQISQDIERRIRRAVRG